LRLTRSLSRNALLGLGLLATAGTSAVLTMRSVLTAQDVVVPDLVGRNLTESFGLAAEQSLSVKVEGRRHDPRVAAERVATQEPPGQSLLKTGRTVRVWVSLG